MTCTTCRFMSPYGTVERRSPPFRVARKWHANTRQHRTLCVTDSDARKRSLDGAQYPRVIVGPPDRTGIM